MSEQQRERATKQEVDGHAGSSSVAAPRGAGVERALARTSDAPLREGNHLISPEERLQIAMARQ
jgi:hypothetical protein